MTTRPCYAEMEIILAGTTIQFSQLGVTMDEIQPILEMCADRSQPPFDDQLGVNIPLAMQEIHLHAFFCVDGEVGLALLEVGVELQIEISSTFDCSGTIAGVEALAGIFVLPLEPQPELPMLTTPVDNGVIEDADFLAITCVEVGVVILIHALP